MQELAQSIDEFMFAVSVVAAIPISTRVPKCDLICPCHAHGQDGVARAVA